MTATRDHSKIVDSLKSLSYSTGGCCCCEDDDSLKREVIRDCQSLMMQVTELKHANRVLREAALPTLPPWRPPE